MADTDDWGGVAVNSQPKPDDWGGVPVDMPKIPDVSGVQKQAQNNLAANDNKDTEEKSPQTPIERLNTSAGFDVGAVINGTAKPSDMSTANRGQYVKALDNGSAVDSSDWMPTHVHAIAPISAGFAPDPNGFLANVGKAETAFIKDIFNPSGGPTNMSAEEYQMYMEKQPKQGYLAQLGEDTSFFTGVLTAPFSPIFSILGAGGIEARKQAFEPEEWERMPEEEKQKNENLGSSVGQGIAGLLLAAAPLAHPPIHDNIFPPAKGGVEPPSGGEGPIIEGEYASSERKLLAAPEGHWDNHPGSDPVVDLVAQKLDKEPSQVTTTDIDQTLAAGAKDLHPPGSDFKSVSIVTGIPAMGLKTLYTETGVKPEQAFTAVQQDPSIATDIAAGKVPEQFEHLVSQKPAMPPEKADKLIINRDNSANSFSVVDKDGDHVSAGFDSYEEAQHYIEYEKLKADERAAIEEEGNAKPQDVFTPEKAAEIENPKAAENISNDIANKVEEMTQDRRDLRLQTLNKKADAGIITPKELGEREALSAKAQESSKVSPFDHQPTEREIPQDNYSKNLSEYSPVMFRETSPAAALELLPHGGVISDVGELHLADTVDMALGQHANKGILIAFDSDGLKGARNRSKPTADISYSQGFGEYLGRHNKQSDYQKAVSAVRIDKDVALSGVDKVRLKRTLKTLEENGWTKTETDKYTEYAKPKETSTELDVAGKQGEQLAAANEGRLKPTVTQKAASEGLFDVAGRGQKDMFANKSNIVLPSASGKVTSLRSFLANNGAKFNEANELLSIKKNNEVIKGSDALEYAHEIAKEQGYLQKYENNQPARPFTDLQDALAHKGGYETTRLADADRVEKAKAALALRKNLDPAKIEQEAHNAGIDTTPVKDETDKQRYKRLLKELNEFWKNQEGSGAVNVIRKGIGETIIAAEKFAGKLTGGVFDRLGEAYVRTFQPELMGDKALRADSCLAKFKAKGQEAENAFYRQSAVSKKMFDRMTPNERMQWLYDHETGRWNDVDDPDHARLQAIYDAMHKAEQAAIGTETAYKENYLSHQWEKPDAVKAFFNSDVMTKKYGADWFTKASEFRLIQEGIIAGFKLKTDNPESMLVARQLASSSMIRTMDLLKDMESSGIAKRASAFSVDKKIAKTQADIADIETKYKKAFEKMNDPNQQRMENVAPATSKLMQAVEARLNFLKKQLDTLTKEKVSNNLTPDQMKELKGGFRVIGPDSHAWSIHQQVAPLWKNAMEMKGLYENQGLTGDAYRAISQVKNIWTDLKLSLSLFHPFHEIGINLASAIVAPIDHLIQGGKFSDLAWSDAKRALPIGSGRGIDAYNTAPELRTPRQKADVQRMVEGGFVPTMSARDMVHFKDNFDKAIKGVGLNNLRLIGTALQLPGKIFEPLFSKWIPRLRSEMYFSLTDKVLQRDPTLMNDVGRRGEVFREISKNIDRTFGQLNQDTLFWNKNVRDSFNAAYISGGWKLAQIYNAKGLLKPLNIAYKSVKTGEFSKKDITYNMLHAYAYTAVTLMMGAAINKMLGNPIGKTWDEAKSLKDYIWSIAQDCLFSKTGDKNPDGTPIRLNQPAFTKEYFMLARDINTDGLIKGAGSFIYHGTLIPGVVDTLTNRDFIGREDISNPLDLHQWMNAGWDGINPITVSTYERAEEKGSSTAKYMGLAGFPVAGAYINQSPFEQKIIAKYDEQNPPKGDAYQAKLKANMRGAIVNKDTEAEAKIEERMKSEGMSSSEIAKSKERHTDKFSDFAWSKLSPQDQRHLIDSASDEEKKKFKVKSE